MTLAIVGGSGLPVLDNLELVAEHSPQTRYGAPSAPILELGTDGRSLFFLARHGSGRHLPPHAIDYRANIAALDALGVTELLAVNVVGGITAAMVPGAWVVPDQIIDYTWGRLHSFHDGSGTVTEHIEFGDPFDRGLSARVLEAAGRQDLNLVAGGTYGCTQGPRLETAAEIRRLERDGCDIVGMTVMPEAALARERGLAYAALCLVVNPAPGKGAEPVSMEQLHAVIDEQMPLAQGIIAALIPARGAAGGS